MKKFPFTKRAIEALPPHEQSSPSREAEYTDMEGVGLHLGATGSALTLGATAIGRKSMADIEKGD